jgi:hypothetical protein
MNWRIGFAATALVAILCAVIAWRASHAVFVVGFWFEEFPFVVSDGATAAMGGPLTASEIDAIKRLSRAELTAAFAGLNLTFTDNARAFWTVRVRGSFERRRSQRLPIAGETFAMGLLGGRSAVNFNEVAMAAIAHAPPGATRHILVEGIGRGIGRTAAHEVAHAILGVHGPMDNRTDAMSYEYFTHNRPSQFYGELHWAGAWPVLVERVGTETLLLAHERQRRGHRTHCENVPANAPAAFSSPEKKSSPMAVC